MKINDFIEIAEKDSLLYREFERDILPHTLAWEGGSKLHKIKGDSGGWTKFGIAYNKNKRYFDDLPDFKDTTYQEASAFAFVMYYLPLRPEYLPKSCRLYLFDMAYNIGTHRTIRYMQMCIGVPVDGVIGRITKSRMHLLQKYCLHRKRLGWYRFLSKKRWARKFYKGWINRANDILRK